MSLQGILVYDVEADGLLDTVSKIHQISILDFDAWMDAGCPRKYSNSAGWLSSYNDFNAEPLDAGFERLKNARVTAGHNLLGYDLHAIYKIRGRILHPKDCIDTLVCSRAADPSRMSSLFRDKLKGHSLANYGEMLGFPKLEHEEWDRWSPEMEARCQTDTVLNALVLKLYIKFLIERSDVYWREHWTAWEIAKSTQLGFRLDVPKTRELAGTLAGELEVLQRDMRKIFPIRLVPKDKKQPVKCLKVINKNHPLKGILDPGVSYCPVVEEEFNPSSRQQIADRLIKKYGWKPNKFTNGGQPAVDEEVLADLPYEEADHLLLFLHKDKQLSQLDSAPKPNGFGGGWLHHVRDTGRVHANLNPCRTITARPACNSPNLQQVSKKSDPITKQQDLRMRACWIASLKGDNVLAGWDTEGYAFTRVLEHDRKLVGVDASGLELRIFGHELHPWDNGEYGRILIEGKQEDGTDIHSRVKVMIGAYERNRAKNVKYALIYGASDGKLGRMAHKDAFLAGKKIDIDTLEIAKSQGKSITYPVVGRAIRNKLETGIKGFKELTKAVKIEARSGFIRAIDNRRIYVRSPHSALNSKLQSSGVIAVKEALVISRKELLKVGLHPDYDCALVLWVHDEFQSEADTVDKAQLLGETFAKCMTQAGINLGIKVPLAGDFKVGSSWAETH